MQVRQFVVAAIALLSIPGISAAQSQKSSGKPTRYMVAPQGNEARYVIREQLMGVDLPNDAIGKTTRVDGGLVLGPDGAIVAEGSRFTIDLASLTSDRDMRDNYVRRRTLQTDQFASAVFVPTSITGLKFPLAKSGNVNFQMAGDLTVKNVTRPVTWTVAGKIAEGGAITGEAKTTFKWSDFELEKPRVRSVLSVEDDIKLEYTFFLVPTKE